MKGLRNCANYWLSAVCDQRGRKSICGGVKPKNKVASLMTLGGGESLLKFSTPLLCKQHSYNNCLPFISSSREAAQQNFHPARSD